MGGGEGGAAETLDQLMPFTRNSVLGLEIYSDSRALLDGGRNSALRS